METIGRYKIVGELGRGAMGVVYHAIDPNIGRHVAIKTIRLADATPEEREKLQARLFREARSAGMLSHPGIVTIYDMAQEGDMSYIAMEYVSGPSLESVMAAGQPVEPERLIRILEQTAAALDYAHGKGIVHRDIKPGNLMLGEGGQTKITDFGIAKITASDRLTQAGLIVGTPSYMSPEQVQGHAIDGRADQYSLSVLAYELLTGELPFSGEHLTTVVYKIVCEEPVPPLLLNATLGPQIESVLRRGLSKKPGARYENCTQLVSAMVTAFNNTKGWKSSARGSSSSMPTIGVQSKAEAAAPRGVRVRRRELRQRSHSNAPLWIALLGTIAFLVWAAWPPERWLAQPPPPELPVTAEAPRVVVPPEPKPSPMKTPGEGDSPLAATPPETAPPDSAPPATETKTEEKASRAAQPVEPQSRRAPPPTPGTREIVVSSNPPGARIVLDERTEAGCRTPCAIYAEPGRHTITASLDGYPREIRSILVGEGSNDIVLFDMKKKTGGSLMVTSTPPGAAVFIDNKRQPQPTPSSISLPPGNYSVTVEKDGQRKTQQVDIREGITVLKVTLEP